MAFNNNGEYFLAPGASVRFTLTFTGNGDRGAQFFMAHPYPGPTDFSGGWYNRRDNGVQLTVSAFTKQMAYRRVEAETNFGEFTGRYVYRDPHYKYQFTVTNPTSLYFARYSLSGGGLV